MSWVLQARMDRFRAVNKAAGYQKGGGAEAGLDMNAMRRLVNSLPQYRLGPLVWVACWTVPPVN